MLETNTGANVVTTEVGWEITITRFFSAIVQRVIGRKSLLMVDVNEMGVCDASHTRPEPRDDFKEHQRTAAQWPTAEAICRNRAEDGAQLRSTHSDAA